MLEELLIELLRMFYPSLCLYCNKELDHPNHLLCQPCISTLQFAYHDPEVREVYCFEQNSAAQALLRAFTKTHFFKIRDVIVGLFVMKYMQLDRDLPDLVLPALHKDNLVLAQAFAKVIGKPYIDAFKFVLDPRVYDDRGRLVGHTTLKQGALSKVCSTHHLLVLDGYDYLPGEYTKVLQRHGYERVTYLSALFVYTPEH